MSLRYRVLAVTEKLRRLGVGCALRERPNPVPSLTPEACTSEVEAPALAKSLARILIVDDEPRILTVTSHMLRSAAYEVTAVGSGVEALQLIENQDFDLVIADVRMPGLSGPDLVRRMRYAQAAKIVFMTGGVQISEAELLKRGAVAVLKKPFRLAELLSTVTMALCGAAGKASTPPT